MGFDPPDSFYDPPEGHKEGCPCEACHAGHIRNGMVLENAETGDFKCCQEENENE